MKTYKAKITIEVEFKSDEYDNPETMLEELQNETNYSIGSTECVEVIDTEIVDAELV